MTSYKLFKDVIQESELDVHDDNLGAVLGKNIIQEGMVGIYTEEMSGVYALRFTIHEKSARNLVRLSKRILSATIDK